jgi:hypothetical protein
MGHPVYSNPMEIRRLVDTWHSSQHERIMMCLIMMIVSIRLTAVVSWGLLRITVMTVQNECTIAAKRIFLPLPFIKCATVIFIRTTSKTMPLIIVPMAFVDNTRCIRTRAYFICCLDNAMACLKVYVLYQSHIEHRRPIFLRIVRGFWHLPTCHGHFACRFSTCQHIQTRHREYTCPAYRYSFVQ